MRYLLVHQRSFFLGFAVLDPIYGNNTNTNLVIGIVSIVVNAITIPLGLTLINKGQDKLKQRVAVKKSNGSTQVEIKLGQKGTTKKTIKKVSVPDNVPVSDEEAKALSEVGIQREIDLVHAEFADHAGKKDAKPMNPT